MPLTTEEKALHNTAIGGSLIAAVLGVNPFARPIDAWLHLTGRAQKDTNEPVTSWGHAMEDMLSSWYEEKTGTEVVPCPTLVHPDKPWIIATPDRIVQDSDVLVECKHVGDRVAWHWYDGPPDYVVLQCVWQMLVCRALGMPITRVDVVADIAGAPPEIFPVEYDAELEAMVLEAAIRFWEDRVQADVAPPVDASESYQAWLRRQFPNSNGVMREEPEAEEWAVRYNAAKETEKAAKEESELAANHLRALIADDDGVRGIWGKVTNRTSASGSRTLRVTLATSPRSRRKGRATIRDIGGLDI